MEKVETPQLQTKVAFIGTGVMGAPMVGHLLNAGYAVKVYTRTKQKAEALLQHGASWASSPGEAVAGAQFVCTMVGTPEDVREVYLSSHGIFGNAQKGACVIDFTTSDPRLAAELAKKGESLGLDVVDAPVTGGQKGAIEARLSILAGGSEAAFSKAEALLKRLGTARRLGPAGSGQYAKLSNQVAIAGTMLGVAEALSIAIRTGLDPAQLIEGISGGAAASWTLQNLAPKMIKGDFAPGFYVKHFVKDLKLAAAVADAIGVDYPVLKLALKRYQELAASGGADLGTQALINLYEKGMTR